MADRRDGITWVALELTRQGERLVEEGLFENEVRRVLGVDDTWPVFVPSKIYEKRGKKVAVHLMEGYAFVGTGLDEVRYFRLEGSKLIEKVMAQVGVRGMRVLSVIPDAHIRELKKQLAQEVSTDIVPGMVVKVTEGVYAKLEGEVKDVEGDHAVVHFVLRSLEVLAKIPKVFLDTNWSEEDEVIVE